MDSRLCSHLYSGIGSVGSISESELDLRSEGEDMSRYAKAANSIVPYKAAWMIVLAFIVMPYAFAQRTHLKPGMNFFSPQQDIEVGQKVAKDAEQKLPMEALLATGMPQRLLTAQRCPYSPPAPTSVLNRD